MSAFFRSPPALLLRFPSLWPVIQWGEIMRLLSDFASLLRLFRRSVRPEDCVPKDKFDFAAVRKAAALGYPGLNPVLPQLLIWMQDYNWPVAKELAPLLARAGPEIAPHLIEVLRSNDGIWKYWVLCALAEDLDPEVWALIRPEVQRIAEAPSQIDIEDLAHEVAVELMAERPGSEDGPHRRDDPRS